MNTRRAAAVWSSVGAVAILVIAAVVITLTHSSGARAEGGSPAARASTLLATGVAGLSPESLAIAGVDAAGVSAVVSAVSVWAGEHGASLESTLRNEASARTAYESARAEAQAGLRSAEGLASLQSAWQAAVSARAALAASALQASGLSSGQRAIVGAASVVASAAGGELPGAYRAADLNEVGRRDARELLAIERVCASLGEEQPPEATSGLSALRARPDVSAVISNEAARLSAARTAWATAFVSLSP